MSFVTDHISEIDVQLDRLQLIGEHSVTSSPGLPSSSETAQEVSEPSQSRYYVSNRILKLQAAIKALTTASSSRVLLHPNTISAALDHILESSSHNSQESSINFPREQELEWLVISKATNQAFGLTLSAILERAVPLSDNIGYWNEVLASNKYIGLYTIQRTPLRLWYLTNDIYIDVWQRIKTIRNAHPGENVLLRPLSDRWRIFYRLVKNSVRDRSLTDTHSAVMSPLTKSRLEARSKRSQLQRLKDTSASGLGILMNECMVFGLEDEEKVFRPEPNSKEEWQSVVWKSVSLMETILRNIHSLELGASEFEDTVFMSVDDDSQSMQNDIIDNPSVSQTVQLADRLQQILSVYLPAHLTVSRELTTEFGRPSRLIRYWFPMLALLLSSSTLLRIFVNRKAEIVSWIRDLGTTSIDFWNNWVVDPVRKVVATVRHDKDSELALMSKDSLQSDKASLERMVVDFAEDHTHTLSGAPLTDAEVAAIRAKVKEGDLTLVLRAYEKDLRKPFIGSFKGDLIRALLIQVQKTKVDVELAVGGIDSLLKSQELVFGFVGLTPGILVCLAVVRWVNELFAGKRGSSEGKKQGSMVRTLRNIDRILSRSTPSENGMLCYKDHGMLLCEVEVFGQRANSSLPHQMKNELMEDLKDLVDLRSGVERQIRVVERIRWSYSRWLQC